MKSETSFQIQQSHASIEQLIKVKKAFNRLYDTRKLNQFQEKYGNIFWQNAITVNRGGFLDESARGGILNEETIIIPIVIQGEQVVKAYLEASLLDSVLLSIKTAGEYDNFQFSTEPMIPELAEKYAIQFMLLNKEVFNDSLFKITDKRLFWGSTTYLDTFYTEKKVFLKAAYNEICVQIWTTTISNHCSFPPNKCPNYITGVLGPCDGCNSCQTSSTSSEFICDGWWQEGGSGGSGDSGGTSGSSSSGSSGGGGSSTTEPCNPGGLLNSFSFPCGILEPPGWEPIDPEYQAFDPQNPCNVVDSLLKTQQFSGMLKKLRDSVHLNHEIGYSQTNTLNPTNYLENYYSGTDDSLNVDITLYSPVDGVGHNHYNDQKRMHNFSAEDIFKIADYWNGGKILNLSTFTYSVVTDSTAYILMIDDSRSFISFATTWFNTIGHFQAFKTWLYATHEYAKDGNSIAQDEKSLLTALQAPPLNGAGFRLFRGNSNMTIFTPIHVDNNGLVRVYPCN
jgi:uncharacterized membrane protein YgcG